MKIDNGRLKEADRLIEINNRKDVIGILIIGHLVGCREEQNKLKAFLRKPRSSYETVPLRTKI